MMSEATKKKLAWILMTCMCVAVGGALTWLHGEGTRTCQQLVANVPTQQAEKPCLISYRGSAEGPVYRKVRLTWNGEALHSVSFVRNLRQGETNTTTISCTTFGRVILPLRHYRHWLTISVLRKMGNREATTWTVIDKRFEKRGAVADRQVRGFDGDNDGELDQIQTKTRRPGPNDEGYISTLRYFAPDTGQRYRHVEVRRNLQSQVVERRILQAKRGMLNHISYEYDCPASK